MKKYPVLVIMLVVAGGAGWYYYEYHWEPSPDELTICSFNIQFLGNFTKKDDETLAKVVQDFDIVVVQELVAPHVDGNYPDGETYSSDPEAAEFFQAMQERGFTYTLSEEDTGTGDDKEPSDKPLQSSCLCLRTVLVCPDFSVGYLLPQSSTGRQIIGSGEPTCCL